MISLLGLILNTLGAFVILVPDFPKLYRSAHRLPPLQTIEAGEKQLYHNGEIEPDDPGFGYISEAFLSESPPLSGTPRLDKSDNNSVIVEVDGEEIKSDSGGFVVKRILHNEAPTVSDSTYTVELYSEPLHSLNDDLAEHGIATPDPYLTMDSAQGAIPEYIENYKRKIIFRAGAVLLLLGFILQAIEKIAIL